MTTANKAKAGAAGIVLASLALTATIRQDEGREYQPYLDIVGVPTVCDGITGPDVVPGKIYTDADCNRRQINEKFAYYCSGIGI